MADCFDASELLRNVSDAYRAIRTLEIEAVNITESGDEDSSSRLEQRVRFLYSAPNRLRFDRCGKNGTLHVADGTRLHQLNRHHLPFENGPRSSSVPIPEMLCLPGVFRPDFPLTDDPIFLFQGIEQRVADAKILREEDGCYVVAVTYERSPDVGMIHGDILFWVNTNTLIVMKQQGDLGHRFPAQDEVIWRRLTVAVRKIQLNEPISEDAFRFTPPPDAVSPAAGRCGISVGGGGGFIQHGPDERSRIEHRGSHKWQGDTLIEHSKWRMRGMDLTFERRLTFSGDEKELNIAERIEGPGGEAGGSFKLPLK
jgi:outer membrane lipoprotein-sorting protein